MCVAGVLVVANRPSGTGPEPSDRRDPVEDSSTWPGGVSLVSSERGWSRGPDGPDVALQHPGRRVSLSLTPMATEIDGTLRYLSWVPAEPGAPGQDQTGRAPVPLGRRSIRQLDLATGTDTELVPGGFSFAVAADGSFATARGEPELRPGVQDLTVIEVTDVDGELLPWTIGDHSDAGLAWAGSTLLMQRDAVVGDAESIGDVIAMDGPGSSWVVAERARLLAVSPDGTTVIVATVADDGSHGLAHVRVVDGAVAGGVDLGHVEGGTFGGGRRCCLEWRPPRRLGLDRRRTAARGALAGRG